MIKQIKKTKKPTLLQNNIGFLVFTFYLMQK